MVPISTVEKPGFIKMVSKLYPRYTKVKDRRIAQLAKVSTFTITPAVVRYDVQALYVRYGSLHQGLGGEKCLPANK